MKAKKEFREERTDVYSFWIEKKVINENNEIEVVDEKIDESTLIGVQDRIVHFENEIATLQDKKSVEQLKIQLINAL